MKFLIIFALIIAITSAFEIRSIRKLKQRSVLVVPTDFEDKPTSRIINGQIAQPGQFPYQVAITAVLSESFTLIGSGSIISSNWIITSAQCVDGMQSVTIGYGSNVRSSPKVSLTVPSSDIFVHPAYLNIALLNDIALIRVPTIDFDENIQPIKLPMATDDATDGAYSTYAGEYGILSGWGKITNDDVGPSDVLHFAHMPIISNEECSQVYGPLIRSTNLCASTTAGVSFCYGDSGAPIVSEITGELIGLTSFGALYPTCTTNEPDAFTRITSYLSWITATTGITK